MSTNDRLARLDDLKARGLLSEAEYREKREQIARSGEPTKLSIEEGLQDANSRFRAGQLTSDEFVAVRAKVLARLNPAEIDPGDGLVLLRRLLERKLISQIEYGRKREQMLAAL